MKLKQSNYRIQIFVEKLKNILGVDSSCILAIRPRRYTLVQLAPIIL